LIKGLCHDMDIFYKDSAGQFILCWPIFSTDFPGTFCTLAQLFWCNANSSPTDVSPTEVSRILCPLDKESLGYCVPDRTIPIGPKWHSSNSSMPFSQGQKEPNPLPLALVMDLLASKTLRTLAV
jgi:hypothetical protein